jgi:predicted ATP-binding protein involved in virulence
VFFKKLEINHWQQFERIDISFDNRLVVITGANGSGKTTLLNILAKHSGWTANSLAIPKQDIATKAIKYFTRWWKRNNKSNENIIGSIQYSNQTKASLVISNQNSTQYQVNIQPQQQIKCFFIPSHRSIFKYQKITSIPTQKKTKQSAFNEVFNSTKQRFQVSSHYSDNNSYLMKNTLVSWAIQGYGNQVMLPDQELINNYEGFKDVLKKVLPKTLGFENFEIRDMEIVFICNNGEDEFLLETASGGISALIDIAWQVYMYATNKDEEFTVIIDEVENHLHPTMQRNILPSLLDAFPNTKFIVSTHSPLIVGSVKESTTYALKYNKNKKIESYKLDFEEQIKTASEILDEVLGVSFTMPIWVENKIEQIIDRYIQKDMTQDDFSNLRQELKDIGLEKLMPFAITNIVDRYNG